MACCAAIIPSWATACMLWVTHRALACAVHGYRHPLTTHAPATISKQALPPVQPLHPTDRTPQPSNASPPTAPDSSTRHPQNPLLQLCTPAEGADSPQLLLCPCTAPWLGMASTVGNPQLHCLAQSSTTQQASRLQQPRPAWGLPPASPGSAMGCVPHTAARCHGHNSQQCTALELCQVATHHVTSPCTTPETHTHPEWLLCQPGARRRALPTAAPMPGAAGGEACHSPGHSHHRSGGNSHMLRPPLPGPGATNG